MVVRMKKASIVDDLPDFDASFSTFSFLLKKLLIIGACGGELVGEGVEVYGENAVFESVPTNVGRIDTHNLAVDYIIVQSPVPGSLCSTLFGYFCC